MIAIDYIAVSASIPALPLPPLSINFCNRCAVKHSLIESTPAVSYEIPPPRRRAPCRAQVLSALDGDIIIHDPSTMVLCDGKFYTYGTGGSSLVSEDGWTWHRGAPLPRRGLAPDVIHLGQRYYVYVAANIGAQPKAAINMIWSKTLDPNSSDYKWQEGGVVASSDGKEDANAIDPGVFLDPTTGRLWLTYGSYFGYIRLVELNPKTGQRLNPERQAPQPRHQLRSVRHDVSQRLVLSSGYPRKLLPWRRLRLQHPRRSRQKSLRPILRCRRE